MEFKKEIRENNRKGPRLGKGEFSTIIVCEDLYDKWIKDNPEYKKISFKEFKIIWNEIAKEVRKQTCYNALGVNLPFYTGETKIQFIPVDVKGVDRGTSNEIGEKANHLNINTKGKIAKITWQRRNACKFNKMLHLFGFEQDRLLSQEANEALNTNPEIYRTMKIINYKHDE